MKRTWLVAQLLWIVAAPAAAQVQAQGDVQVGGGDAGGPGLAPEGFLLGARLLVAHPADVGGIDVGGVGVDPTVDSVPRYFLGYRLGKLGFVGGFQIASVATSDEVGDDDPEVSTFVFALSPQLLYELASTGRVAIDFYGGPTFAFGSHSESNRDFGILTLGVDAGVRAIGYLLANLGLFADLGLDVAFATLDRDEADDDADERQTVLFGFYGAVGVMGTL